LELILLKIIIISIDRSQFADIMIGIHRKYHQPPNIGNKYFIANIRAASSMANRIKYKIKKIITTNLTRLSI
jgi:hypothetical protein